MANSVVSATGFTGANKLVHPRFLLETVGVEAVNMKPNAELQLVPWQQPLQVATIARTGAKSLYRMGRDALTPGASWLSWTGRVHAMRGFDASDDSERTFYTGDGVPKWTDVTMGIATPPWPSAARLLAVPQPDAAPLLELYDDGEDDAEPRDLYYVYTWVNDIGWESAPSNPGMFTSKSGAKVKMTAPATVPTGSYGVNRIRWYRTQTGASGTADFYFLAEFPINTALMLDEDPDLGESLPSSNWTPLADNATCLTDCWNQFAAALVDKTVRFCEPNYIYAWPLDYEYVLSNTPIGAAAFAQRLMVFTSAGAEVFTGSDPSALDQQPLSVPACVSERSIVSGDAFCMWVGRDGAYYYGTDGFKALTKGIIKEADWLAMSPETMVGCYLGGLYVLFYGADGARKGLVIDPSSDTAAFWLDVGYDAAYWDKLLRKMYVLSGQNILEFDGGAAPMTAKFISKVFRQAQDVQPDWIEVLADGSVHLTLTVDGVTRMDRSLTTGDWRVPDGITGTDWQVELQTTSRLQAVEIS